MSWFISNFVPIVLCAMFAIPTFLLLGISMLQEKGIEITDAEESFDTEDEPRETPFSLVMCGVLVLVVLLVGGGWIYFR